MKLGENNFLEYLGTEEQNLLTNIVNYKKEFDIFYNIDRIYQEPLKRLVVSSDDSVVPRLYLFVHFHLYFSMSCLLRSHLSENFSSLRKAIDASLSAYKIIQEPSKKAAYLERDAYFQFIKSNMQREIKKDPSLYPLAHDLINVHDTCSEYGSHADVSSFVHRLETKDTDDKKRKILFLHYFQFPRNFEEYKYFFLTTLQSYYSMFLIFKIFLDKNLKIIDPKWEVTIEHLGPMLNRLREDSFVKSNETP